MSKKIAVINDLSGFGRCSLTAALPVISVMEVQPCPLPTAILTGQTGYPSYYCDDYTGKMEYFREEWEKMGVRFDGIYTGFVAGEEQIGQIFRFLDTFYKNDTFLLVDPVMGDDGEVYKLFTKKLLYRMKELALQADILTPNLTELCLLTDEDYQKVQVLKDGQSIRTAVGKMARSLIQKGVKTVIVTGIRFQEMDSSGRNVQKIGNLTVTKEECVLSSFPYIGGSFSGTGDLFASVIAGGAARGRDIFELVELAGTFVGEAMRDSAGEQVDRNDGTNFEKHLGMLM